MIDKAIAEGKEIQVKLKNDMGPPLAGKIDKLEFIASNAHPDLRPEIVYRVITKATIGLPDPRRPNQFKEKLVNLPIMFAIEDVLWVTDGPLTEDGEAMIVSPFASDGHTTPGGLHIGGR